VEKFVIVQNFISEDFVITTKFVI